MSMRDKLTSSELLVYMKKAHININIEFLGGLLNALDMNKLGASIVLVELLRRCQDFVAETNMERQDTTLLKGSGGPEKSLNKIKDAIYKHGKNARDFF